MAKKAPAKPAAKRKPLAKKPVQPSIEQIELPDFVKEELSAIYEKRKALKADSAESSSLWRRLLFGGAVVAGLVVSFGGGVWSAGGINVGPKPKNDSVSEVFSTQETEFRNAIGELVGKLRAGELTSEQQAKEWMEGRYVPEAEKAWQKLLMAEKAAFGEDRWTAEKHAAFIEEYTR